MEGYGSISWRCAHRVGVRDTCDKEATHSKYGMDRCDEHELDLSPCVWEANMKRKFPFCGIDHETYGHIFGDVCRNSPEDRKKVLRSLMAGLNNLISSEA